MEFKNHVIPTGYINAKTLKYDYVLSGSSTFLICVYKDKDWTTSGWHSKEEYEANCPNGLVSFEVSCNDEWWESRGYTDDGSPDNEWLFQHNGSVYNSAVGEFMQAEGLI